MDMIQFVSALPKVELHLHLVGSAAAETVLALARRHPDGGVPADRQALRQFYAFTDFPHFLDVYAQVNLLVRTGADVITLIDGLAGQLTESNVRYAEVQVTPVRNRMAGISFADLAQALTDGRSLARRHHGVELGWIFDADAALGPPGAGNSRLRSAVPPRGHRRSWPWRPGIRGAPGRLRTGLPRGPGRWAAQRATRWGDRGT